ncbi:FAD binding domain-containing protein [Pleomassaria siparia CBS 279.74]|uniref:FAD binding domain-containing protein n=1 Tax=Pleomassaria siparia CBS 279.74 TaxID=1314801 RepID=A0A6G1KTD6_9PLEO|nr:FAD binding domain-containing protein [Pleomassaria siparia CBS 279.74]
MSRLWFSLLIVAATSSFTRAQNETTGSADYCCTILASNPLVGERVTFPGQSAYNESVASYFDIKSRLTPNCIVGPESSAEVATIVKALTADSGSEPCQFAIRSGGHTPYIGASNIENGITIDLQHLNATTYDAATKLASIGPGARWRSVYHTLESLGVMVIGGRDASVGVGGLITGGGISYYSYRYGLACDNVVNFEVVLADGRVVNANKDSNADLYTALKGGNNNFGIITRFDMQTFVNEGMWGGLVSYPASTISAQFKALTNFIKNIDTDTNAAAIVMQMFSTQAGNNSLVVNSYAYTKPTVRPAAYDEFLAVQGNISDSMSLQNMSGVVGEFDGAPSFRVYFGTLSFANDIRVLEKASELYNNVLAKLQAEATGNWIAYALYQPLPPQYTKDSASRGGNILGLERFTDAFIVYQPYLSWEGSEQDALFQSQGAYLVDEIKQFAASIGATVEYLYLNYADITQDPLASYGKENVKKLKAVGSKYDPSGVFQNLVPGGFKLSNVKI